MRAGARDLVRNATLMCVSLIVMGGLVECGLRATGAFNARVAWTEPDPQIGFRATPGRTTWSFEENEHPVYGRINTMGWRDRERTRAKPAATTRIAVLGDSYVEALQVEIDSTFVSIAERTIVARGLSCEVMNFGRSGMGQAEELVVLERDIIPCDPDTVVLLYTPSNDIADASPSTTNRARRPFVVVSDDGSLVVDTSFNSSFGQRARALLNPIKQNSALVSLVSFRYSAWRADRKMARKLGASKELTAVERVMTAHPDSMFAANYALTKRIVAAMARTCRDRGIGFVLMSVPQAYSDRTIAELQRIDPTYDPEFFDRDFAAMADSSGFAVLGLTGAFREDFRETGEPLNWAHWNYRGHRVAARVLADWVAPASSN